MNELIDEIKVYCVEEDMRLRTYLKKLEIRLKAKKKTENADICKDIVSSLDYHIRKNKGENTDTSMSQDIAETLF